MAKLFGGRCGPNGKYGWTGWFTDFLPACRAGVVAAVPVAVDGCAAAGARADVPGQAVEELAGTLPFAGWKDEALFLAGDAVQVRGDICPGVWCGCGGGAVSSGVVEGVGALAVSAAGVELFAGEDEFSVVGLVRAVRFGFGRADDLAPAGSVLLWDPHPGGEPGVAWVGDPHRNPAPCRTRDDKFVQLGCRLWWQAQRGQVPVGVESSAGPHPTRAGAETLAAFIAPPLLQVPGAGPDQHGFAAGNDMPRLVIDEYPGRSVDER
ncbi:hypothetical protein [Streptomyces sp. WY228]|uniref:hypothetical protein n=1 Tax=Streptomyces sp. WY228 TaxID=2855836 RepID=UPI001C4FD308|nr:hypothetical protein [Streptomyces sp. WY228]QXR00592.1 hypothetical protein KV381_32580 [Streptomyces sp. WY228]